MLSVDPAFASSASPWPHEFGWFGHAGAFRTLDFA